MPLVKGISVTIHTKNGPLAEYGTRRLGSGSIISSFIQSEDNTPFWIKFHVTSPFDFKSSLDTSRARYSSTKAPVWGAVSGMWDFSAHIFIDDNASSDKNLIIDLPRNKKGGDQIVVARGRSCVDRDGVPGEQRWMFKEVGLESYFKGLTTDECGREDEWEMVSDGGRADTARCNTSLGQIKIQLFRVRQRGVDKARKPERAWEGSSQQTQISLNADISHTISVGNPKPRAFHYVTVDYLDGPKDPWATIIFMYRGKKQLQKMGFTTSSARGNGRDIFEPGPSRSLSSNMNSMIFCGNENPNNQDNNNTPAKKRGLLVGDGNMPSPVAGESGRFPSSKPTEVVIFVKPIINLKRKPLQQGDIITGLSTMSLDTKDQLWQADPNGSGQINPKRKSVDDAPVLEEASAGLKKMKVGEAGVALI